MYSSADFCKTVVGLDKWTNWEVACFHQLNIQRGAHEWQTFTEAFTFKSSLLPSQVIEKKWCASSKEIKKKRSFFGFQSFAQSLAVCLRSMLSLNNRSKICVLLLSPISAMHKKSSDTTAIVINLVGNAVVSCVGRSDVPENLREFVIQTYAYCICRCVICVELNFKFGIGIVCCSLPQYLNTISSLIISDTNNCLV